MNFVRVKRNDGWWLSADGKFFSGMGMGSIFPEDQGRQLAEEHGCTTVRVTTWRGSPITTCDVCKHKIGASFYDGATRHGPWAIMCHTCWSLIGTGTGDGKGQRYTLDKGTWVKTHG